MRDGRMAEVLTRLALAAGAAIMTVYRNPAFAVRTKADSTPVTEADLEADRIIVAGLREAFPAMPIVTEERSETHDLGIGRDHFLIDPLDGTREFAARRGDFTVNIALIEGGQPVAGVVFAPVSGRLFRTEPGGGATVMVDDARAMPLRAVSADPAAPRVVASTSHRDPATDAWIASHAPNATLRSAGSSLKFCMIAAGDADLYPRLGRTMEWDTAAGDAVLRAAGGRVVTADTGRPLIYGKADRVNPAFIAAGPGVVLPV